MIHCVPFTIQKLLPVVQKTIDSISLVHPEDSEVVMEQLRGLNCAPGFYQPHRVCKTILRKASLDMSNEGSDIWIKAGSVELDYDETVYPRDPGSPTTHRNPTKKITRIVITGGNIEFDTGEQTQGLSCSILIQCR